MLEPTDHTKGSIKELLICD